MGEVELQRVLKVSYIYYFPFYAIKYNMAGRSVSRFIVLLLACCQYCFINLPELAKHVFFGQFLHLFIFLTKFYNFFCVVKYILKFVTVCLTDDCNPVMTWFSPHQATVGVWAATTIHLAVSQKSLLASQLKNVQRHSLEQECC